MTHFDAVVLGAGPGGYMAAIRCAQLGLKTAIVESQWWGGAVNAAGLPMKALLRNAEVAHLIKHESATYGITGDLSCDYSAAFARSRTVGDRMVQSVHFLMRKNKITEYNGWGTFKSPTTLSVSFDTGVVESLTFDNCIIATGALPRMPESVKKGTRITTYAELVTSPILPASIIICGAGAIGAEFAYILANYGTKVTLVEEAERILAREDAEVSAEVAKAYRSLGVTIVTGGSIRQISQDDHMATVRLTPASGGEEVVLQADQVLVSMGFQPRTQGYGLATTGVALTEPGAIAVDDHMRTNVSGLYAVGDITGKAMLAHVAVQQGVLAAETIGGVQTFPIDYAMVPRAIYSQPQVASFGYTEAQARQRGYDVRTNKFPLSASGQAWALGQTSGFVKIVADAAHHEILGVHMVGVNVTELLPELVLARMWDLTTDEIGRTMHVHPSLSEAVREAAGGVDGQMLSF